MPWLTPVVFKQGPDESLTNLPRFGDGAKKIRFRHIIHIYNDTTVPENTAVLPITFDTVERARRFAGPDYPVTCVAVTFPEDVGLVPASVVTAPALDRYVTDVAQFAVPRPLPLLFDILKNGVSPPLAGRATSPLHLGRLVGCLFGAAPQGKQEREYQEEVEFLILTNADIHLQPAFYLVLAEFIEQGYDVITVNRRTIATDPSSRAFSPHFWAERGSDHGGLDCFVFPTRMMADFVRSHSCCGAGHVMRALLFNLVAHARRFLMLTHAQMTFHLGDDRHWADPRFADYQEFNIAQAQSVIATLAENHEKAERLAAFITAHEMEVFRKTLPATLTHRPIVHGDSA
jgi:hypothetical protein